MKRIALLILLMLGAPLCARADEVQLQEQAIEAGLLYNFLKYVEWPANSTALASPDVEVCVFGGNSLGGYLKPMSGRTVNQRPIAVRNVHSLQDAAGCQLVFIGAEEKERWPQLLKSLSGKDVLTVGNFSEFAQSGGMIEFGRKNDHVSVQLNTDSVSAARLHVGDRLLKLVTVVHSGGS